MLTRSVRALLASALVAVSPWAVAQGDKPIQDNSFLLEEAYNQEPGVIQHISLFQYVSVFARATDGTVWTYAFTEEWPVFSQTHQASVTLQGLRAESLDGTRTTGFGDVLLNYRWQAVGSGETPVAVAPRLSAILPTGDWKQGFGLGGPGVQVNLPISAMLGERLVGHFNLGSTWIPSARAPAGDGPVVGLNLGQGLIWLAHRNVNLMLEAAFSTTELHVTGPNARVETFFLSPGIRGALNFSSGLQVVGGVAMPIGFGPSTGSKAILGYLSFEHPITKTASPE